MRKEIFIAIGVGVLFGSVVTFGIYTANKALVNRSRSQTPSTTTIPTPTPTPQSPIALAISEPSDNTVTDQNQITVKGRTIPLGVVAFVTEDNQFLVEANSDGVFSQVIGLSRGANTVDITASDMNQVSQTQTLHIVYTTELEE